MSPNSQKSDDDIINFLLELNSTQGSLSDKSPSQKSNKSHKFNLSLHCKEEGLSSSDEEEQSILMTQQVFYGTEQAKVLQPSVLKIDLKKDDIPSIHSTDFNKEPDDEADFDDFTDSQMLQIDGNNNDTKVSKRKRLGARPAKSAIIPSSSSTSSISRILRSSKSVEKDLTQLQSNKICTRDSTANSTQNSKHNSNVLIKALINPTKATLINPTKATLINPTKATLINPKKSTSINHTEFASINPKKSASINPTKSTSINPTKSTSVNHTKATSIKPTKYAPINPVIPPKLEDSSKHITKLNLTQNSPDINFSLSQFNNLRFSPSSGKAKNYRKLKILSPSSNIPSQTRRSLSLKRKKTSKADVKKSQTTPVKKFVSPRIEKDAFVPKKLFSPISGAEFSPKTKLAKVLTDEDRLSIDSFHTGSPDRMSSSSSSEDNKEYTNGSLESKKKALVQQTESVKKEELKLDNKVLMWLSESECSQDESDVIKPNSDFQVNEKSTTEFVDLSDSLTYSPASPKSLRKRKVSFASNKSVSLFESSFDNSNDTAQYISVHTKKYKSKNEKHYILNNPLQSSVDDPPPISSQYSSIKSSKVTITSLDDSNNSKNSGKFSITSPVILSSSPRNSKTSAECLMESNFTVLTPKLEVSSTSPTTMIDSDIDSNSIFSTPKNIEFDTSLFYSQYQLDDELRPLETISNQTYKYKILPPSVTDCLNFVKLIKNSDSLILEPHYSIVEDIPGPSTVGSKKIDFRQSTSLPDQIFFPECEKDIGVLGIESWEEVITAKYEISEYSTISLKYSTQAPSVADARKWLFQKINRNMSFESSSFLSGTKNKTETESLTNALCSTPINAKVHLSSLSEKFITPIVKNPITKFKRKIKFSPGIDSLKTPISPTLCMNAYTSQLSNNDSFKFGMTNPMGDCTKSHAVQHLTVLSLEVFASTAVDKQPNPRYDPVEAVFYAIYNDNNQDITEGSVCVNPPGLRSKCIPPSVLLVDSESDVFQEIFRIVHENDPDIITGYEIKMSSLGYLIERANTIGLNFQANISRFPEETKDIKDETGVSNWWVTTSNEIQLAGRVIINLWRLMRTEVSLTNYSFENVAYHVLHERLPRLPQTTLFTFYQDTKSFLNFIDYFTIRARGNLRLLLDLNILVRTSEMGRLFGIEFFNVLSRGSQYRVESMMSRLSKPLKFISISPSPDQRATMAAPEFIPLVMEPESKFYGDPVVVLDFQSLYPSMIIAYNMCYSTCLGRVNYLGTYGSFPFGAANLNITPNTLKKYEKHMFVSPCGVAFVNQSVRKGVLPMMLNEILETRIMVKQMMKQHKDDKALYKMLDARQMALKLIANVTYGYTSANFSGRMPCIEIGDSIVAKGRETLESAIELVNSTPKWGGHVVYGDTDSLFILFEGCSKEDAFKRGHEIAEVVTALNPKPVKLKFEKVYYPCVLQTKKRYVGMKYETPDDSGEYEAKGIETVRRDGCPVSVKTLKRALHILFKSGDLSNVKTFVQDQFMKIAKNQISVQEFIFAKEYRGKDSYRPGACVPAFEIAKKRLKHDSRSEPLIGERVQYVICYGTPGLPLIQLVHEPAQLLSSNNLYINSIYYITKAVVPPLQRVFGLMGANVLAWYNELPRDLRLHFAPSNNRSKHTISHYYHTKHCPFCDEVTDSLCSCYLDKQKVGVLVNSELSLLKDKLQSIYTICVDCSNAPSLVRNPDTPHNINCVSFVCPIMFKRVKLCNRISEKEVTKSEVNKLYDW